MLLAVFSYYVRPRVTALPANILPRRQFTALYNLADEVSRPLKAPAIDGIVVDGRYNASFRQVGWRRKTYPHPGPTFSLTVTNDEETVALVAHELAHGVNGDAAPGSFIGGAVGIVASWYDLLRPGSFGASGHQIYGEVGLCGIVANGVLHILARGIWIGAYALHHLLRRDSQRAEYLADHLAAQIAGTAAMLSLLDKLHFGHKLEDAVQAVGVFGKGNGDIADELQKQIADMPARELERIRRVERLQTSRLDISHPPTGYRIEFLRTRDAPAPVVTISQEESEQMMRELISLRPAIQQALLAEWRWRNLHS